MTPKGRETNKTDLDQRRKFSGLVTKLHGNEGKTHLGTDIWVDSVMIKQALADSNWKQLPRESCDALNVFGTCEFTKRRKSCNVAQLLREKIKIAFFHFPLSFVVKEKIREFSTNFFILLLNIKRF